MKFWVYMYTQSHVFTEFKIRRGAMCVRELRNVSKLI